MNFYSYQYDPGSKMLRPLILKQSISDSKLLSSDFGVAVSLDSDD